MYSKKSGRKQNTIWINQGSKFCNRSNDNEIEKNSTHSEGKSVVSGRFIRMLKSKINKHMIMVSKTMYIYRLDKKVDKYNNAYRGKSK